MPEISLVFGPDSKAIVSSTGAALLELSIDSKRLITRTVDSIEIFAGSVLAPWQNRLAQGEWLDSSGDKRSLAINEQVLGNALHGLVFAAEFVVLEQSSNRVVLGKQIVATDGYPFNVDIEITYEINELGFSCEFSATNASESAAPFVIGFHPYFTIGDPEGATLKIPAQSYYPQDANKIPLAKASVIGTSFDFRSARELVGVTLDDYFTDLETTNGEVTSSLRTANWSMELSQSANLRHLVVYLKNDYESEGKLVTAIAIEPASGPANALNSKEDLTLIEPADSFRGNWSVRLTAQ
jgi:aldose 1-epimerase